jgi:hypothetical protein
MKDMFGRNIARGDFVVYYSKLYEVRYTTSGTTPRGYGYAEIMIYPASKTSKPVKKYSQEMVLVPKEDVMMHLLREGRL